MRYPQKFLDRTRPLAIIGTPLTLKRNYPAFSMLVVSLRSNCTVWIPMWSSRSAKALPFCNNWADAAKSNPEFLDPHQNEILIVLAERIIPGSSKAQVNRFIDLPLSVDTQEAQKKFLASLSAFEAEPLQRFSRPYKGVSESQQNEILTYASTAKPAKSAEGKTAHLPMRDHFENKKSWVVGAFYSPEIGSDIFRSVRPQGNLTRLHRLGSINPDLAESTR